MRMMKQLFVILALGACLAACDEGKNPNPDALLKDALVKDALTYVDMPCASPDQNPVCWGKTLAVCLNFETKYCSIIGVPESMAVHAQARLVEPTSTSSEEEESSEYATIRALREPKPRGPLQQDPWTMSFAQITELLSEDNYSLEFEDFVRVWPARFKSETSVPQELQGDYELRIWVSISSGDDATISNSYFFVFEEGRWRAVSRQSSLLTPANEYESEQPKECDPAGWICEVYGITPWGDPGKPNK